MLAALRHSGKHEICRLPQTQTSCRETIIIIVHSSRPMTMLLFGCYGSWLLWKLVAMEVGCYGSWLLWKLAAMEVGCYGSWLLWKLVAMEVGCYGS
jgi:hypothetical protein